MKEIKFVDPEEVKIPSENPVSKIIIEYLKDGLSQKQIAFNLQKNELKPNRGRLTKRKIFRVKDKIY